MEPQVTSRRAVARLIPLDTDTRPGSAFAITPRLALTAFHCVGRRVSASVRLRFEGGATVTASAIRGDDDSDIALLALDQPVPFQLSPVPLVVGSSVWDDRFLAEGFGVDSPAGSAPHAIDGRIVTTTLLFDRLVPALQLLSDQLAAGEDPHQFSGGPVLVRVTRVPRPLYAAVGVVRWAPVREDQPERAIGGTFYATPIETAAALWPEVKAITNVTGTLSTGNLNLRSGHPGGLVADPEPTLRVPRIRPKRPPPLVRPRPFGRHLDRAIEMDRVIALAAHEGLVNVWGEADIGKTFILVALANRSDAAPSKLAVLYVDASHKTLDDVVYKIFDDLHTSEPPARLPRPDIVRRLRRRRALVLIDESSLSSDDIREIVQALSADSRVIVGSREYVARDGAEVPVAGLPMPDGVALIEQALGQPLDDAGRAAAEEIWAALRGHPARMRTAVAQVAAGRAELVRVASGLRTDDPPAALAAQVADTVRGLAPEQRRLLMALALLDGASLGRDVLSAIAGVPDVQGMLDLPERLGLIRSHSPRWSATPLLTKEIAGQLESLPAEAKTALLKSTVEWAQGRRWGPAELTPELPALLVALRLMRAEAMLEETVALGRAIEPALIAAKRWDAWEETLQAVRDAARELGDRAAEAWAIHELGTRLLATEDRAEAVRALHEALRLRTELRDTDGQALTEHNLAVASRPVPWLHRWLMRWMVRGSLSAALLVTILLLLGGGAVGALAITSRPSHPVAAPTSLVFACTPARVAVGQRVICAARVSSRRESPRPALGDVTVTTNSRGTFSTGNHCALVPDGQSSDCSITYVPSAPGTDTFAATYAGDHKHMPSRQAAQVIVTAARAVRASSTSIKCIPAAIAPGNQAICTATVSDAASGTRVTPTGAISFSSNPTGGFPAGATCALVDEGNRSASCMAAYTGTAPGTHAITAGYGGDAVHRQSQQTTRVSVSGGPATRPTRMALACVPARVDLGAPTTCIATVSELASSGKSTPTGTVGFASSAQGSFASSRTCTLGAGHGSASCQVKYVPGAPGVQTISATYSGDSLDLATHQATEITVAGSSASRATRTELSCSGAQVGAAQPASCTATVTDAAPGTAVTPTGSVSFPSVAGGSFSSGTCQLVTVAGGSAAASCQVTYTPTAAGHQQVTAIYSGDGQHSSSQQTTLIVARAPLRATQMDLSCSAGQLSVNRSTTCTATVTDTAAGTPATPTGTVTFPTVSGGSFSAGTCQLSPASGGPAVASCQVTYTPSAAGPQTITATYGGDSVHSASQQTAQVMAISLRPTTTSVECAGVSQSIRGGAPACYALVQDTGTGTPITPTGSATFTASAGSFPSGSSCSLQAVSGHPGAAACRVSYSPPAAQSNQSTTGTTSSTPAPAAAVARLSVSATYGGDSNHQGSTGSFP